MGLGNLFAKKRRVQVTVAVTYVNGRSDTHRTVWETRKSPKAVATIVRGWMNSGSTSTVDIEGDNPVVINLHNVTNSTVTAREV